MHLRNLLMISSLVFLNACDCSGSKGEGCGLALAGAAAIIAAPIAVPVMIANQRGPEPRIDSKNNRIQLDGNGTEANAAYIAHYKQELSNMKNNAIRYADNTVTWKNFGAEKLSGSYIFNSQIWSVVAIPRSNMVAISIIRKDEESKVVLLDLASEQTKFAVLVEDNLLPDITASPDGNYLLILSSPHQIDVYDIIKYVHIGSISTGAFVKRPIFEANKNHFSTLIGSKVFAFSINAE